MKTTKRRLDVAVMERFGLSSRNEAQKVIMAGKVHSATKKLDKAGMTIADDEEIFLKDYQKDFVSRGGYKLKGALESFCVDVKGKVAVDVGISTGGFTDCLFQKGASHVFGFDVGYGMVDWAVRKNENLTLYERTNFRKLTEEEIESFGIAAEIVVMDVSFISVTLMTENILHLYRKDAQELSSFLKKEPDFEERGRFISEYNLSEGLFVNEVPDKLRGVLITLIKPQFELSKEKLGKGGIVKNEVYLSEAITKVLTQYSDNGLSNIDIITSPITGTKGNTEFLLLSGVIS